MSQVFITGGTGYIGRALIVELKNRGHSIRALCRPGSQKKMPTGVEIVEGNALDGLTYKQSVLPGSTFIHLIGVPNPSPLKEKEFWEVDFVSGREAVHAAREAQVDHFIYLSVAQPAPIMQAYQEVRRDVEKLITESTLKATLLRPWYILGPGHYWPMIFLPFYYLFEKFDATKEAAQRLGLIRLELIINALVHAVEDVPVGVRIWQVPDIRHLQKV